MDDRRKSILDAYGIHISFKYIRYMEGTDKLELDVEPLTHGPSVIYLPSPEKWNNEMPDWAKDRRAEILGRIKDGTKHLDWTWEEY
jgi:hypothetical protein